MRIILFFALLFLSINTYSQEYVQSPPIKGKGVSALLSKFNLLDELSTRELFYSLNDIDKNNPELYSAKLYTLPIRIFAYNDKNIRSTIGIDEYDAALAIQKYNESLSANSIRRGSYKQDKRLFVPIVSFYVGGQLVKSPIEDNSIITQIENRTVNYPIFGEKYKNVSIESKALSGITFYLVAGHGGPDPGAIGTNSGHTLHEDEYAYDVILRLGKKIIENGGVAKFIIQDEEDGIRDDRYLNNSKTETCMGDPIPLNQVERLHQRTDRINDLYDKNEEGSYKHHFISIHVDSRASSDSQIDVFFYHAEGSVEGERIADALRDKLEEKYKAAQPGRGYKGSVRHRGLYVIRKSKPISTFIELGNIQNDRDQRRILEPDNRQAIANWLTEGLIEYYNN